MSVDVISVDIVPVTQTAPQLSSSGRPSPSIVTRIVWFGGGGGTIGSEYRFKYDGQVFELATKLIADGSDPTARSAVGPS